MRFNILKFCDFIIIIFNKKNICLHFFLGIAFGFKLQFMFIMPLYIVLYVMNNKYSILHFFLIPITDIVMCVPAIIAGKPLIELLFVYFNQTSEYTSTVLNFSSLFIKSKG